MTRYGAGGKSLNSRERTCLTISHWFIGLRGPTLTKRAKMPQQTAAQVVESQRQDWNRVASGWEKWDRVFDENMTCLNHRLVADARLRAGLQVLDLGSGT